MEKSYTLQETTDPRIARSRDAIESAMLSLLQQYGWQAISVSKITAQAGVNRSTFYAHYTDKYDLMSHVVRRTFREQLEQNLPTAAEFCCERIKHLIITTCKYMARFLSGCAATQDEIIPLVKTEIQTALFNYILDWLRSQPTVPNPEVLAMTMSWTIFGTAAQWQHLDSVDSMEEAADRVYDLITKMTVDIVTESSAFPQR